MDFEDQLRTAGSALKRWFVAQAYDALCVGALWLAGLLLIHVPWAPLWAILGAMLQFIPNLGLVCALIGPAIAAALSGGLDRLLYVLILYAGIAMSDGFLLQPILMKRIARVPIWASILCPIVLGIFLSFWGVLISAPLLAVIAAYRARAGGQAGRRQPS